MALDDHISKLLWIRLLQRIPPFNQTIRLVLALGTLSRYGSIHISTSYSIVMCVGKFRMTGPPHKVQIQLYSLLFRLSHLLFVLYQVDSTQLVDFTFFLHYKWITVGICVGRQEFHSQKLLHPLDEGEKAAE